ncbi:glycosyltransferase family 4 protein [Lacipirellula limnantheis]|uniref:Putative glycosyl transferase n=1 Tax=Lacipirellula limnantheis TaxID=2528024 RepID=A0A517TUA8_9BACT|nr:glycosyltransferase family 4 protein [Lacipirellula limnantheis]QDT71963.1 putative glycosyl transferase [Lacipirellula limnantheis]
MPQRTLLLISQVYPPDPAAVGRHMHDAAEEMVRRGWRVVVYTSRRGYADASQRYAARELLDGVEIRRLPLSSFGKSTLALRLLGQILFVAQAAIRGMFVRGLSTILVSTSPPMAGAAALWIRCFRRVPIKFWVMDLSVDQMIEAGLAKPNAITTRLLRSVYRWTLQNSQDVVALDRFMVQRIADSYGVDRGVHILPPWPHEDHLDRVAHADNPFRQRHHLHDKFVFMYSGNMGIGHPIGVLLEAAREMADDPQVMFVFIGDGHRRAEVEREIAERCPGNLMLLPYQPLEELCYSLSAADVHLVTMEDGGIGCFHPCKVYGAMAVSRPVLFAGPDPSHVTDLITRYMMGWRISSHDPSSAAEEMRRIAGLPAAELQAMGDRAGAAVSQDLSKTRLCQEFCDIVEKGAAGV